MIRPAGCYKRKDGTWEQFWCTQPDACLYEPAVSADGDRCHIILADVRYPTLAEIPAHARHGTALSHDDVVCLIAAANAPPVCFIDLQVVALA